MNVVTFFFLKKNLKRIMNEEFRKTITGYTMKQPSISILSKFIVRICFGFYLM